MQNENDNVVARTPVKNASQPVHQQLRARRFLGPEATKTDTTSLALTASTPVDPLKARPVRRHIPEQTAVRSGAAVDLQKAFVHDSPAHSTELVTKKVPSVELQPACTTVSRSEETVMMAEAPASPPEASEVLFTALAGMRMSEEEGEHDGDARTLPSGDVCELTDPSTDALCEADSTPAAATLVPERRAQKEGGATAVWPRSASSPPAARASAMAATPSPLDSSLPSCEDDTDEDAESGYGSVCHRGEVSSLKDVTVTPQRQCTSAARSAPSPSLALDDRSGGMSLAVACTPVKAASAALFTGDQSADGSSHACRPLSSSFGIRPKATKRFDFVKAFEPVPVTPEKTAPRFARGSAVEYKLVGNTATTVAMRSERWKVGSPPPPPPLAVTAQGGSGSFQRATRTVSRQSSAEEQPPRRPLCSGGRTMHRGVDLMTVRETSPPSRPAQLIGANKNTSARAGVAPEVGASEPVDTEEPATSQPAPRPPTLSSEEASPASPRSLNSAHTRTGTQPRGTRSQDWGSSSPSPDPIVAEKQEDFKLYRKRSFCRFSDNGLYDATNKAFQEGVTRTTLPRSAMPFDAHTDRQRRMRENNEAAETDDDSDDSNTESSESEHGGDIDTTSCPRATPSSPTHTLLPGVDSTSISNLSNGKRADSTGRPTTGGGATTRGVSSSNGCTTDERASRSTSREYEEEEEEGEASSSVPAPPTHAVPVSSLRAAHGGRRGTGLSADAAADASDDEAHEVSCGGEASVTAMRFPFNHNDVVDLSAITIASLDGDDEGAVASKSYENFLAATTTPPHALSLDQARSGAAAAAVFAQQVTALLGCVEAQYATLLAEHRENILLDFLTMTERCVESQLRAQEKRKAAIFGTQSGELPLAIALPTTAPVAGKAEVYSPMARVYPASPYVSAATTVFGMAPRTSRPPSAPRSRRASGDETGAVPVAEEACVPAPKHLPKVTPAFNPLVAVEASLSCPFQSPLRLIFRLSVEATATSSDSTTTAAIAATMDALLAVYFDFHAQEHLRRVQHTLFDFMYYTMVGVPAVRMLEAHERRLICMTRDLLIRDRIELFMLTLPRGAHGGGGGGRYPPGAIRLHGSGGSGEKSRTANSGGLLASFRSTYEDVKARSLTSYQQEKEKRLAQWAAPVASGSQNAKASLRAVEEYKTGTGARPSSATSAAPRQRAASLSAASSAPRQFPSPAQMAAVRTAGSGAAQAAFSTSQSGRGSTSTVSPLVPLSSRSRRVALPKRSASLPHVRQSPAHTRSPSTEAPTTPPAVQQTRTILTVMARGGRRKSREGDTATYRRASGEIVLNDGSRLLRAKERIQPIARNRSPPPPPSEDQFMNLADIEPR